VDCRTESQPVLSVVVPCHDEADCIAEFHRRLSAVMMDLGEPWEAVFVNDGSADQTLQALRALHQTDPHLAIVNLSRNFGQEVAITAGLDHASGQAVIVIDADLQDPPELIPVLAAVWRTGADMVYARRRHRAGETWFKRTSAALFYLLMQRIGRVRLPRDTGYFRLMSRRTVDAVLQLREQHRFMRGLFAWVGFRSEAVLYDRAPRLKGRSKSSSRRMWDLALEGITGFSAMPLKLATYLGFAVALFAAICGGLVVTRTLIYGNPLAGYPSLMAVVLFLGGTQLMTLGILGEYVGRIFDESKRRPLYFLEGFEPSRASQADGLADADITRRTGGQLPRPPHSTQPA
jgi:glycosyltransferase involved in cell wall biosynthesis